MKKFLLLFPLAVCVPGLALARSGKLSTLTLAFPDGAPTATAQRVTDYLNKDITLIEGTFINAFVTQKFSGSTDNLNKLIPLLRHSRFDLIVSFNDLKNAHVSFSLDQHMGDPEKITITINTASKDFTWSELKIRIPAARGNVEPDDPANGSQR